MRKKLLYVISALANHGGLERIVIDKLNWLVEHSQYDVFLLTFDQGSHPMAYPLHPHVNYANLDIMIHLEYKFSGLRRLICRFKLHTYLRKKLSFKINEISPNVVVCCERLFVPDVEKSRGCIPLVYECHSGYLGFKLEGASLFQKMQIRLCDWAIRKVEYVVTLTDGDASNWRKVNSHVVTIPNTVHLNCTERYSDCMTKSIIFVGRYSAQKDIGSLLRIWEIVYSRHPDWQLHLYGGYGDEQEKWFHFVEQMHSGVFAHKASSYILDKFLGNSMLLLTSLHEPFGLVLPEAMSCGLPVVSFDCPYGPADIISDGVDGFLIKDRDIEGFAKRVCQLIENQELRVKMGQEGILSSQRYRADVIMPKWIQLFNQITHNSR